MSKNLINLLVLTLVTLLLWVTFQIFQITTQSNIPKATEKQLETLNPDLDTNLIETLKDSGKTLRLNPDSTTF